MCWMRKEPCQMSVNISRGSTYKYLQRWCLQSTYLRIESKRAYVGQGKLILRNCGLHYYNAITEFDSRSLLAVQPRRETNGNLSETLKANGYIWSSWIITRISLFSICTRQGHVLCVKECNTILHIRGLVNEFMYQLKTYPIGELSLKLVQTHASAWFMYHPLITFGYIYYNFVRNCRITVC